MSSTQDRITLIVLRPDGTRAKHALSSLVGIPRKAELFWLGETPHVVVEVEYAAVERFFGGMSIEAAGVYVRPLSDEEQAQVARRLGPPAPARPDERAFRP